MVAPEKEQPNQNEQRRHAGQSVFQRKPNETRRRHFLLVGDGFDHEIRRVADVCVGAEKHGANADGHKKFG